MIIIIYNSFYLNKVERHTSLYVIKNEYIFPRTKIKIK
jgi:hypothetical protein